MKSKKRGRVASIREVANKARVSVATVSRVLNGHDHVSNVLRKRVERAVEEIGYAPNAIARGLRTNRTRTIGLILRDVANTEFATVWKAASDVAALHSYRVLVTSSERDPVKEVDCVRLMMQNRVDGIVAFVADEANSALANQAAQVPLVLVESQLPNVDVDRVSSDNFGGAYQAVAYLISLGHRRIEILAGSSHRSPGRERARAYREAFAANSLEVDETAVWDVSHLDGAAADLLEKKLLGASRPTAIFAATSHLTIEVLALIKRIRLKLPEQISFIGFDNAAVANLTTPTLTTVQRNIYDIGVAAVETLIARIEDGASEPIRNVKLPAQLIIRNSCSVFSDSTSGRAA